MMKKYKKKKLTGEIINQEEQSYLMNKRRNK